MATRGKRKGSIKGTGTGRVVNIARRTGLRKGVLGGNRGWAAVFLLSWGYGKLKQAAQRDADIVLSEELPPGQRIIIANGRASVDN